MDLSWRRDVLTSSSLARCLLQYIALAVSSSSNILTCIVVVAGVDMVAAVVMVAGVVMVHDFRI